MTKPDVELDFAARAALVELEEAAMAPEPDQAADRITWPTLRPEALHGYAGRLVETLDPYTEADPNATLFTFLAFAGCYLGNSPHILGGNAPHPARIWPILTGASSSGAKGTAIAAVVQVIRYIDNGFLAGNRVSGLSSAEGLIRRVRDQTGDTPEDPKFDEGIADKRLLVVESEFVNVLTRSRREGSALSGTIRDAYDGVPLQTLTSGNPLRATDPHITILGAITPEELVERMTIGDITNGFANRFMVVASRRSKLIPDGGSPPPGKLQALAGEFRDLAEAAGRVRQMERTPAARELWSAEYVRRMTAYDNVKGPIATLFSRWHANTTRMAVAYALLDGRDSIDLVHVQAALAAWDYVDASTRYVFGSEDADPDLGRLVEFIDSAEMGRTREQISSELYQRRKTKKQLDDLCGRLLALGRYKAIPVPPDSGRGRPRTFYVRVAQGVRSGS